MSPLAGFEDLFFFLLYTIFSEEFFQQDSYCSHLFLFVHKGQGICLPNLMSGKSHGMIQSRKNQSMWWRGSISKMFSGPALSQQTKNGICPSLLPLSPKASMLLIHLMAVQGSVLTASLTLLLLPPGHHHVIGGPMEKTPCPSLQKYDPLLILVMLNYFFGKDFCSIGLSVVKNKSL